MSRGKWSEKSKSERFKTIKTRYIGSSDRDLSYGQLGDAAPADGYDDPSSMLCSVMMFWPTGVKRARSSAHYVMDNELTTVSTT